MNPDTPIRTQVAAGEIARVAGAVQKVLAAYATDFALRQQTGPRQSV
jgi:hypothetical protein